MPLLSSAPTSDNHTITPPGLRPGGDPARRRTAPTKRRQMRRPPPGTIPASTANYKCWPIAAPKPTSGKHTHAKRAPCRRRKQEGRTHATCRRPPYHDACKNRFLHARTTGTSSPPHDVQGTCAVAPAQRAGGAQTGCPLRAAGPGPGHDGRTSPEGKRGLVGLGRLERPTSRLSGVRSNQLSYRPERHPAGPGTRAARAGRAQTSSPQDPMVRRLCAKGRADGGGRFLPQLGQSRPTHGPHLHAGCVHPAVGSP